MENRILLKRAVNRVCLIVAGIVMSVAHAPAHAEFGDQLFQLSASDAIPSDAFGHSVSISGNMAIIGRSNSSGFAPDIPGAAYVFDLMTGQELRNFTPAGILKSDEFGKSVAISGNVAIVGAQAFLTAGTPGPHKPGAAYLFDVTTGEQLFKLTPSDSALLDIFGHSVAIDGNTAVVGAHLNDTAGDEAGAAYIFDVATGQQRFKLTPSDAAEGDRFGGQVAISGNIAVVGAPASFAADNKAGSAYLFDVTTGEQLYKLMPSDSAPRDWFGTGVGISGNIAIVGAPRGNPQNPGPGSAYLFDVTTGQELYRLSESDAAASEWFGVRVDISGSTAIVAVDNHGESTNSVYVFDVSTGQELINLNGSVGPEEFFGSALAIDNDIAIVGAPFYAPPRNNPYPPGSAYVFDVSRSPTLPGDFNNDGTVDAADYVVWRNGLGTSYTQTDYNAWRANLGRSVAGESAVSRAVLGLAVGVPEPASIALAAVGVFSLFLLMSTRTAALAPRGTAQSSS
jgi:outer membrane protein assembly factor BamB